MIYDVLAVSNESLTMKACASKKRQSRSKKRKFALFLSINQKMHKG